MNRENPRRRRRLGFRERPYCECKDRWSGEKEEEMVVDTSQEDLLLHVVSFQRYGHYNSIRFGEAL